MHIFLFKPPPPVSFFSVETRLINLNKIPIIFAFGQYDWMDKVGAYRLSKYDPNKYEVFTISKGVHSFSYENPTELCALIGQYFEV